MKLVGDSELALRFLSLLPGVLLLPLLAQLGRRIGGRPFALLLTLLLAISQSHVWISQDVRNQYTLGLLLIVSATLLLTKLVDEEWGGGINGRFSNTFSRWGWLLYALLSTLAVYSHYYTAFALLGHGIYILAQPPKRKQFWRWAGAGLLASLLFLPWVAVMLPGLLAAGQLSDPATPELANYLAMVGTEAMAGSALSGSWLRWLFLGSLALSIVGARQLWRRHAGWAGLLLIWLGATTLFIYLIQFSRATFNPFYITIAAPAWWLLIVAGVQFLWRRRRVTAVFSIAALIIISSISLHNYYSEPEYSRSLGYRQMAEHITKQVQPDDLFLAHFPDPSLVYYLRNVALDYTMQPARYRPPVAETEQALAELAADYGRIWFVPAPGSAWDVGNIVPNWLASHTLREQETTYNRLTLSAHRSAEAAISVAYPIARQLGDAIQLDSVFVTVDGIPVDLERPFATAPESQLIVTILWHTSTQINEHYTVFVQLLDENGMLVAQDDNIPTKGLRPTTTWQSQEIIIDSHTLTLPVDRIILQGSLIVGMYQTETVERLLFDDGTDAAHIATIKNER
ncbi:MAG: hypothetical protein GY805_01035 [Chloroflexi bacterium]|nr:hypothetical protein [Chloroflexota bacterium]